MGEFAGFRVGVCKRVPFGCLARNVFLDSLPQQFILGPILRVFKNFLLFIAIGFQVNASHSAEWVGLVHAQADVQLSVPVAGLVRRVHATPGQIIKAGDILLELESELQSLELRRRKIILDDESELHAASERLIGVSQMLKMAEEVASNSLSLSKEEILKLQLERVGAEARLNQLRAQKTRERVEAEQAQADVELRRLRSPGQGIVVEVSADAGEWAKPGDAVIRMVDVTSVEVRVNLPQAVAINLRVGMKVLAQFESGAQSTQSAGMLRFVSPTADSASGLVEIRAIFPNPRGTLRPGSKAIIRNFS